MKVVNALKFFYYLQRKCHLLLRKQKGDLSEDLNS